jgi:hypothetical protein
VTPPILALLREPRVVASWGVSEWADTLPRLMQARMASTVAARLQHAGLEMAMLPPAVARQLLASRIVSDAAQRSLRWELGEVERALRGSGIAAVPLKGADYLLRGARAAAGRFVADLDLLVTPAEVDAAKAALVAAGWESSDTPEGWRRDGNVHLPMMIHTVRQTQLELHYAMVAGGGTVAMDISAMIAAATARQGSDFRLLRPEDCTLVCVSHYIRNVRAISAFRDLHDLRELVEDFVQGDRDFVQALTRRAEQVGLGPALSRAVRDAVALLGATASPELDAWAVARRPVLAGGSVEALIPDGHTLPSLQRRIHRVGRMFARLRSSRSRFGTLGAGYDLLFGKGGDVA